MIKRLYIDWRCSIAHERLLGGKGCKHPCRNFEADMSTANEHVWRML